MAYQDHKRKIYLELDWNYKTIASTSDYFEHRNALNLHFNKYLKSFAYFIN